MPIYTYKAVSHSGMISHGTLFTHSTQTLSVILQNRGLLLIYAKTHKKPRFLRKLSINLQRDFCLYLRQLTQVGVPVTEALDDLLNASDSSQLKYSLTCIIQAMKEGRSLSDALLTIKELFDPLLPAVLVVAEQTGNLALPLASFERYLNWQQSLQDQIGKNLRYPLLIATLIISLLIIFSIVLLPNLPSFFHTMGIQELPWVTISLLTFVEFWANWGGLIILLGGGLAFIYRSFAKYRQFSWGGLHQQWHLAHFLQGFALMIRVGHDTLTAIRQSQSLSTNSWLMSRLTKVSDRLLTGESLSLAIPAELPTSAIINRMLLLGESSGNLANLLDSAVECHREELIKRSEKLAFWAGPCLVGTAGLVLIWIISAIMVPLYAQLGSLDW